MAYYDNILPHIQRLYRKSECRTPLICCTENGDPLKSIEALAKQNGSTVWTISMDTPKNERNALDYLEVGLANGDWLYLVQCEKASMKVMRDIGLQLVQVTPDPKKYPRRGDFRLWLLVEKPIDINDNINPVFPAVLTQHALYGWRDAATNVAKVQLKSKVDPELHDHQEGMKMVRAERGQDPDDESDDEESAKKATGMWFHRAVEFFQADSENVATRSAEDIFDAIEKGNTARVKEICAMNTIDINLVTRFGATPLMWAIVNNHIDVVRVLLENQADPNQRRAANNQPVTFMNIDSPDMLQLLLDWGADIDARWEGKTLLEHSDTAPAIVQFLQKYNNI